MIEMKSKNIKNIESKKNRKNKKDNGITLIALVITIIVLLILAGITITSITSDNGIIQNALSAKEMTEIDNEREIVEQATVQAMGNNKRGNIVRDELQEELDKITGEGKTIVTADTEEGGYFVKFVDSGRIYKVSIDGEVTYLGEEDELLTRADITANPESDTTPKLTQEVGLTVKTLIDIGDVDYTLVYAWSSSQDIAPADSEFEVADLTGEGRIRTTKVSSDVSAEGNYYLWVRAVVGEIEQETCFGPYAIKDHTMLMRVNENDSLSDAGFLGNVTVKRGLIKSITIQNTLGGHNLADANTWDVTENGNGRYLAWYEGDEENGYDVTIAGEGGIVANSNSSYLFRNIGSGIANGEVTITGLEYLDTGLVTGSMASMFGNCKATSLNLSNFDTSNVTSTVNMFGGCTKLTSLDLSSFDTSNVTSMSGMFSNCSVTNLDLSSFDTSNVTSMRVMFSNCSVTNLDLSSFDTSNVTDMRSMFYFCTNLTSLNLSNFNTSNVTNMEQIFNNCNNLVYLDISNFNTSKITNMSYMFNDCRSLTNLNLNNFDTSNVTSMFYTFCGCRSLTNLNVSNFDTINVTNMQRMFSNCTNLTSLDLSSFNTSNVTNMQWMFSICTNLTSLDLSSFNTSNVTGMAHMFNNCTNLTSLDLSSFNTSNVRDMSYMFSSCRSLTNLNVSNFDTSNVIDVGYIFSACSNLKVLNISKFNTQNVTNWVNMLLNVPTSIPIITNQSTKEWILDKFPSYTNITVVE